MGPEKREETVKYVGLVTGHRERAEVEISRVARDTPGSKGTHEKRNVGDSGRT